ncbi:SRPBCC family protein [Pseudonocardia sp. ICBG1293]|uniref:SRPBCC family protein n=1 Tax=Pseudonocardia sp. ICBG1293 TaxID=2844382 RepID=UPI001CCB6639|nr:SRPBCC family protein [Pseudonocardia sp. ICBG1293]
MPRSRTISDEIHVEASPEALWRLVADPARYPEWSPENTGATLPAGSTPAVGDAFVGSNRRGPLRWTTRCVVTEVEPGRRFGFSARDWGLRSPTLRIRNAAWRYQLDPDGTATRVRLTWTDERPWPDAVAAVVDRIVTSGHTFAEFQHDNIGRSLAGLRRVAERTG